MQLWSEWCACVQALRPACTRSATFAWMTLALAGFCVRSERAGVTSFVRALALRPDLYPRLLHLFHSRALRLDRLTRLWVKLCIDRLPAYRVGTALVCVADGLKVGKEGRKMPAVKRLHQSSTNNSKPEFIDGHSLQALALLVRTSTDQAFAVPLAARIHEGVRDRTPTGEPRATLLDRLVELLLQILPHGTPAILVADAFYASGKVMRPLLDAGHHLVTRAKSNAVAYRPLPRSRGPRKRGRPRLYGGKVRIRNLFRASDVFRTAPSPVYGDRHVQIEYRSVTLLWRPVARPVQFVLVRHPHRGKITLMTTDTALDPLEVIRLYGYRFKIEAGFRQALHVLGTYAYHFWMAPMRTRKRAVGDQDIRAQSDQYRAQVWRKISAYHRFIQLGCIAHGLLQHLSIRFGPQIWHRFRSWLRTMDPELLPSEQVVGQALRNSLPEFLADPENAQPFAKFLTQHQTPELIGCCRCASG
jgi:Transposase DDE domain